MERVDRPKKCLILVCSMAIIPNETNNLSLLFLSRREILGSLEVYIFINFLLINRQEEYDCQFFSCVFTTHIDVSDKKAVKSKRFIRKKCTHLRNVNFAKRILYLADSIVSSSFSRLTKILRVKVRIEKKDCNHEAT